MPEGTDAVLSTEWKIQRYRLKIASNRRVQWFNEKFSTTLPNHLPIMGKQPAVSRERHSTSQCTPESADDSSSAAAEKHGKLYI